MLVTGFFVDTFTEGLKTDLCRPGAVSGSASLEAMDSFLDKWESTSFHNAMGGDLGTSTLTTSKSSSSSSKMAGPEAKVKKETVKKDKMAVPEAKVKKETAVKKDKKEKKQKKEKQEEKLKAAKSEACEVEVKKEDGWPSGLLRPPPPPNLKAEPVATTESSEMRPGFAPRTAGSTRDLSMHFFGYKRRAGGWKHNPKRARGRGRN